MPAFISINALHYSVSYGNGLVNVVILVNACMCLLSQNISSVSFHNTVTSNQIKFIEQQRARGASCRLLKHEINNYYMYTLYAKKNKNKNEKKTLRPHEHYVKFAVQKLTK